MACNIEIFRKDQHKTSEWSGGTTTELYIYPKDSIYGERDFKWRLSSANVEVDKSTFTSVQGISRLIMIIEGELHLYHENHHNAHLKAYEQDSFNGEWTTTSFGKVTDFNLMLSKGYKGRLQCISFNKSKFKNIILHNKETDDFFSSTEAFYVVKGDVEIVRSVEQNINISKGDLALVTIIDKENISEMKIYSNNKEEDAKIIRATILYCD